MVQHTGQSDIPISMIQEAAPLPGNGKFHVRLVEGFYQNLRRAISWPLIALFFAFVWVEIDNQPLLMFDFSARRIFMFGLELSWYDLPILAGLMICGASLLFFMAVGWGRIWCGFACPQSIWTWIFIRLENMTEGSAAKRAKVEHLPLNGLRLLRRVLKHFSWISVSLFTAITFSGYFTPIRELISNLTSLEASAFVWTWIISMALLTYFNAGLVREKVCLHMCPYSRFQGVMFDSDTRTVSYDVQRGEPRHKRRQGQVERKGDCVDCSLCVQVCPTGIDIRDGLQAACIDCGACIDACDQVMKKLGLATGLIEFRSENQLQTPHLVSTPPGALHEKQNRILRPRLLGYLSILVITSWSVVYALGHRTDLLVEIERDRGQLFQVKGEQVCNHYRIELESFSDKLTQLKVSISPQAPLQQFTSKGPEHINLSNGPSYALYQICATPEPSNPRSNIEFRFQQDAFSVSKQSTFISATP